MCGEPIVIESGGALVFANAAAVELFGARTAAELLGRRLVELIPSLAGKLVRKRDPGATQGRHVAMRMGGEALDVEIAAEPCIFAQRDASQMIVRAISEDEARSRRVPVPEAWGKLARLTPRELQVLDLLVVGKASKMIAHILGTSARTIDVHRARVMRKMQADSVASLVTMMLEARG
jgi:DNA-binding CsgD family transcriptional regulator